MSKNLVFALHGFLGHPNDWVFVKKHLVQKPIDWINPAFFTEESLQVTNFERYTDHLASQIPRVGYRKKIFLGYSLGGRLGLHLLKKYSDFFDHFIFISTHVGLETEAERDSRLIQDQIWAQKLSKNQWSDFLSEWNGQKVLNSNLNGPQRERKDYELAKLIAALKLWSLGRQEDLSATVRLHQKKVLWAVGDKDEKFLKLGEELKQKKILLEINRIDSGHRILFENPKAIAELVQQLL